MTNDQELLNIYGSPLYVYQGDRIRDTIRYISYAVPYPRTRFQFASVTNGNVALLQIFQQEGWGLHGNTPGDIYLGLKAGFAPNNIVYSGSNLNRAEMEQVLHWGITTLNLDSISQLELCCQVYHSLNSKLPRLNLGLRLNVPEITGDSRIGVQPEDFPEALKITQAAGLHLKGIHFYRGTGTNATKAFTQVIDSLCDIGQQLPDWNYLDFGGGFGYPYQGNGVAFDWQGFGQAITQKLETIGRTIDLIIEPGRAAIAGCASLLAKVVSVKWQNGKQIVGVDTTVANLSVPSVHGGYRKIISFTDNQREQYPTDVCGNTTYSRDYLGRNCQLPALKNGDVIAILDSGAYGYAMSSHFLHRPRPAEVLVEQGTHRLIRKREDYSILLNNQVFTSQI